MRHLLAIALFLSLSSPPALAAKERESGEVLYGRYCGACHALDGKGAGDGAFPPLAGSEWITGNPKRIVAVIQKGLQGPIEVAGKSYNLAMPPHEDALDDNTITAIVNYVHQAWGNQEAPVQRDLIKNVRSEFADRKQPWTAEELLKLFPIPKKESPLKNLISSVYKGSASLAPDFSEGKALNYEEEHNGFLSLDITPEKEAFGIVWTGDFIAEDSATYDFFLNADDGAKLFFNGEEVLAITEGTFENQSGAKKASTKLKAGTNQFRLEYYQLSANRELAVGWKRKGTGVWNWLSDTAPQLEIKFPEIILAPEREKAVLYRNFIEGVSPRAIGVGFPNSANLAYSADTMSPVLLWSGDFINAGRHWTGRGQGNQSPESKEISTLEKAEISPAPSQFSGYSLDKKNNPTFIIEFENGTLSDTWQSTDDGNLQRTLKLSGELSSVTMTTGSEKMSGQKSVTITNGKATQLTYKLR